MWTAEATSSSRSASVWLMLAPHMICIFSCNLIYTQFYHISIDSCESQYVVCSLAMPYHTLFSSMADASANAAHLPSVSPSFCLVLICVCVCASSGVCRRCDERRREDNKLRCCSLQSAVWRRWMCNSHTLNNFWILMQSIVSFSWHFSHHMRDDWNLRRPRQRRLPRVWVWAQPTYFFASKKKTYTHKHTLCAGAGAWCIIITCAAHSLHCFIFVLFRSLWLARFFLRNSLRPI